MSPPSNGRGLAWLFAIPYSLITVFLSHLPFRSTRVAIGGVCLLCSFLLYQACQRPLEPLHLKLIRSYVPHRTFHQHGPSMPIALMKKTRLFSLTPSLPCPSY